MLLFSTPVRLHLPIPITSILKMMKDVNFGSLRLHADCVVAVEEHGADDVVIVNGLYCYVCVGRMVQAP